MHSERCRSARNFGIDVPHRTQGTVRSRERLVRLGASLHASATVDSETLNTAATAAEMDGPSLDVTGIPQPSSFRMASGISTSFLKIHRGGRPLPLGRCALAGGQSESNEGTSPSLRDPLCAARASQ